MDWLTDTSVLLRTLDTRNSSQKTALDALAILRTQGGSLCVFPQNLVEFWAVATRPTEANGMGLSAENTRKELDRIKLLFVLKNEDETIFSNWEELVSRYGVSGKATHDARIVAAMQTHRIDNILTFNIDDFKRYADAINPKSPDEIISASGR